MTPSMKKTLLTSAVALGLAALTVSAQAADGHDMDMAGKEKCFGVAKAGKNDCGAGKVSCAGSAKMDSQKDAFIVTPKGLCDKLVGGSTTAQ